MNLLPIYVEPDPDGFRIYPAVIDLSIPNIAEAIQPLMDLPIPFVGHFLKAELFCLGKLSIHEPVEAWNTWVFEKPSHLGENHPKYATDKKSQGLDTIMAKEQRQEADQGGIGKTDRVPPTLNNNFIRVGGTLYGGMNCGITTKLQGYCRKI